MMDLSASDARHARSLRPRLSWPGLIFIVIAVLFVLPSAQRVGLGELASPFGTDATAGSASSRFGDLLRPVLAIRTPIDQLDPETRAHPPLFSYTAAETRTEYILDPATLVPVPQEETVEILVQPLGYVGLVLIQMGVTIEIAVWATLLAVAASLPIAIATSVRFTAHPALGMVGRGGVALCRAVPELITALFFVLIFGFGPLAGVLALAFHGIGFLGKFYAETIDETDPAPQDALRAAGMRPLLVLRLSALPQAFPGLAGLTLYLFDRNVRMATVVGLVGGGGIGQELKGRFDLFQYGHMSTIILVIFVAVVLVDQLATFLKRRIARDGTEAARRPSA